MEEYKIIAIVVRYLIKEKRAEISKVSTSEKRQDHYIKRVLRNANISSATVNAIQFRRKEEDIVAYFSFNTGRRQKHLEVEAKGGKVFYNFYTSFGQFICLKRSPSTYHWFAFAFPYSWRDKIRSTLRDTNGKIKPIVAEIIDKFTKHGQGLWFYFVNDDETVIKETWRQTLR